MWHIFGQFKLAFTNSLTFWLCASEIRYSCGWKWFIIFDRLPPRHRFQKVFTFRRICHLLMQSRCCTCSLKQNWTFSVLIRTSFACLHTLVMVELSWKLVAIPVRSDLSNMSSLMRRIEAQTKKSNVSSFPGNTCWFEVKVFESCCFIW